MRKPNAEAVQRVTTPIVRLIRPCFVGAVVAASTLVFIYLALNVDVISYPVLGQGEADEKQLSRRRPDRWLGGTLLLSDDDRPARLLDGAEG